MLPDRYVDPSTQDRGFVVGGRVGACVTVGAAAQEPEIQLLL